MSINGIPVKIRTEDREGNLTNLETFYFATFRKCPKLAQFPKKIMKLDTQIRKARRLAELAAEAMSQADETELDAATQKYDDACEVLMKVDQDHTDQYRKFIETGLKAAGYADTDIERYLTYLEFFNYDEILEKSRFGAGRCDFFTELNPVPPS